jgi:CMP-N-acetylneuraminic acid synthetase
MAGLEDISIVIPVREGSSRIPSKIFLPFGDKKSLLEWKISQVSQVQDKRNIFISSNSPRVEQIAEQTGVNYLPRSDFLCTGHQATFSEVITGVIKDIKTDYFAWVTVVVPLMQPDDYQEAFQLFLRHVAIDKTHNSLVTVNLVKEYLWSETGPLNYQANRNHTISQELPNIYRVTNGLYMRSKAETMTDGYFLGQKPVFHNVSKAAGIDIDEHEDYELAQKFYFGSN